MKKARKDNYFEKYYLFWLFLMKKIKTRKLIVIKKHDFSGENYS